MGVFKDITGLQFGRWKVIKRVENEIVSSSNQYAVFLCRCECGNEKEIRGTHLRSGNTQSCGCLRYEIVVEKNTTHGLSFDRIYQLWCGIKARCNYKNHKGYKNYGDRGIKLCEEWKDFERFWEDMRPSYFEGATIDRIDVNKGYCKENCRWVTRLEQARNKRNNTKVIYKGKKVRLFDLMEISKVSYANLHQRVTDFGWDIENALNVPVKAGNRNPQNKKA